MDPSSERAVGGGELTAKLVGLGLAVSVVDLLSLVGLGPGLSGLAVDLAVDLAMSVVGMKLSKECGVRAVHLVPAKPGPTAPLRW